MHGEGSQRAEDHSRTCRLVKREGEREEEGERDRKRKRAGGGRAGDAPDECGEDDLAQ